MRKKCVRNVIWGTEDGGKEGLGPEGKSWMLGEVKLEYVKRMENITVRRKERLNWTLIKSDAEGN